MSQEINPLAPEAISILFGSSLYQIEEKTTKPLSVLHNTTIKLIVITSVNTANEANASQLALLNSILLACKINSQEVKLIHFNRENTNYKELSSTFNPSFVLLFGISPSEIGLPLMFPHFQLQNFDKTTYISSPALEKIENDKLQKINLWNALKQAFSL
jgi:hypothetical protein